MSDRRRSQRYVLGTPMAADAMPMHDVVIEQIAGPTIVVLSPAAHALNEPLMIHVSGLAGLESRRTTVISSTPISSAGGMQYRLELHLDATAAEGH